MVVVSINLALSPSQRADQMFLQALHLHNFRHLGRGQPIVIPFQEGLNLLVGENDAGKSAVIDALRFCLGTRGAFFERLSETDFYCSASGQTTEFAVRAVFTQLSASEARDLVEWTTPIPAQKGGAARHELHITLTARLHKDGSVYPERRTGPAADGPPVEGRLREYLPATYLRPLRDAAAELRPGRYSRLAQILRALPDMEPEKLSTTPQSLAAIMDASQKAIAANKTIAAIEKRLKADYLDNAALIGTELLPRLGMGTRFTFDHVLERLELNLEPPTGINTRVARGLGLDNVLFMCAELLLLQSEQALPLLLVEEPEAHLHPQMQSSVVAMLEQQSGDRPKAQILLTTHSPLLAASAKPERMVLMTGGAAFPLAAEHTRLEADDYRFLQRFLDATKANLFFAKGVLIVEGDAEQLLLPSIAEKLGCSLTRFGVSIVNVGSVGLFRYARIFQRCSGADISVPVACIADRDIPPIEAKHLLSATRKTETDFDSAALAAHVAKRMRDDAGPVKTFVSPCWTLEFDLAEAGLAKELNRAVHRARHHGYKTRVLLDAEADVAFAGLGGSDRDKAVAIYGALLDGTSKTIVAQELAAIIRDFSDTPTAFRARLPAYLVAAIDHATRGGLLNA